MNDGVVYEKSHTGKIRAVVMRMGVQMKSKWSGTKEGALRSLVVSLSTMWAATDTAFNAVREERDRDQLMLAEDHRPIIADILEGLGFGMMCGPNGGQALRAQIKNNDIIEMDYAVLYQGAATLRWTAQWEAEKSE